MGGEVPSRRGGMKSRISRSFSGLLCGYPGISQRPTRRLGEFEDEEGEEYVEEEEYQESEAVATLAGASEASEAPNLVLCKQSLVSEANPNFLQIMEQMSQSMGQLTQAIAPWDNSRAQAFKTLSMMVPDFFDGTQTHKLRYLYYPVNNP
ncbi:hypothetical protein O181_004587 [Austropuccinia psidii MF-1]|uniref:Uncharacterized protein n=1 Tax=Austropuccinia psidii MF-1 TaxID=1389203 RepID=A0A9Q3BGI8_9BASI|nr:hypothetical protein [Austropuccinia psidii MF-1]